jgi:hypothetical protein
MGDSEGTAADGEKDRKQTGRFRFKSNLSSHDRSELLGLGQPVTAHHQGLERGNVRLPQELMGVISSTPKRSSYEAWVSRWSSSLLACLRASDAVSA